MKIFVSHATKDDELVTQLCASLASMVEAAFWIDHHHLIPPEDNWRGAIQVALRECEVGLVVLSRHSVARAEIVAEWTYLLNIRRGLYVAKVDDVPIADIDYRLHLVQWIDLAQDWQKGIGALAAAINNQTLALDAPTVWVRPVTGHIDRKLLAVPISGREYGLATLRQRLHEEPTTILGVGGIGKSRLAAEIVMTMPDGYGAVWHRCTEQTDPRDIELMLCEHLGLPESTNQHDLLEALRRHPLLLVLDNAEVVTDSQRRAMVGLIEAFYAMGSQVLLTSRSAWDELETGETYRPQRPSVETAEQIVNDMQQAFNVPHNLQPYAHKLALAARQHPGLIEWAVKQTHRFSPEKVIRDLRHLRSKKIQAALDEMIHKTLRIMVKAEGGGIDMALRRLLVFRGSFTYDAAKAVLQVDEDKLDHYLDTLLRRQFIVLYIDPQKQSRYRIDPLVIDVLTSHEPN